MQSPVWRTSAFIVLLACAWAPVPAWCDEAAAWAALRGGSPVALMRHADAPGGVGDPPGYRLDDCASQRNLSPRGRADARAAGERLRAAGVKVGKLLSSPWCRCLETARLLELGEVQVAATFSNAFVLADQRETLTRGARRLLEQWRGPGVLFVVTHGANIQALTGRAPAEGEIVVVRPSGETSLQEIGRIALPPAR
ncbi:MAG TPA: histidine phosphatase family protein [Albitalea sp.]